MKGKVILIISPEPWGMNFVSKHHYANYLSKNNTVYFLNPVKGFIKNPFGNVQCEVNNISKDLFQVDYLNLLPRLNSLPKAVQKSTYKKQAKQIQKSIGIESFDIVWSFDPNRYFDQTVWNAKHSIYHTVDFHPTCKFEKDIVLNSTLFIGVTQLILKEHEAYRVGIEISHAADVDGFEKKVEVTIPGNNAIRAIYTGNFHKHIDYSLLHDLAVNNSIVDFIMVGPTDKSNLATKNTIEVEEFEKLNQLPNLHFVGSVPPDHLQTYISECHINLVLFKKEYEKIHCSPHKLMAYFFSGHVTLSNYIDAHKHTNSDIILMASDFDETLQLFHEITLSIERYNNEANAIKRRQFALENSYENKIETIGNLLYNNQ